MKIGEEGQGLSLAGFADDGFVGWLSWPASALQRTSCLCLPNSGMTSTLSILGVEPRSLSLHGKLFTDSSISPALEFQEESGFYNFLQPLEVTLIT